MPMERTCGSSIQRPTHSRSQLSQVPLEREQKSQALSTRRTVVIMSGTGARHEMSLKYGVCKVALINNTPECISGFLSACIIETRLNCLMI